MAVMLCIVISCATARGHPIHRSEWATEASQPQAGEYGRLGARAIAAALSCEPEVHSHTMAKKTVVLSRPSNTPVTVPIVAEDARWIIAVGKVRYAVDFHATARRLKQAPAKVVPIKSRLGSP